MKIEKSIPNNILKKYYKEDPEDALKDELIKKYGERYSKYRKIICLLLMMMIIK